MSLAVIRGEVMAEYNSNSSSNKKKLPRLPRGKTKQVVITERDLAVLSWIKIHGIVTPEQIGRKFFTRQDGTIGMWAAYRRLTKLAQVSPPLIERDRTFWQYPSVVRITNHGAKLVDLGVGKAHLVVAELRHSLNLVELMETLAASYPKAQMTTERQLRAQIYRDKRDGLRRSTGRIPDGMLTFTNSDPEYVAIELDLSPRRERDVINIVHAYSAQNYGAIWWYVTPARKERITELVKRLKADDFIEVRSWELLY